MQTIFKHQCGVNGLPIVVMPILNEIKGNDQGHKPWQSSFSLSAIRGSLDLYAFLQL